MAAIENCTAVLTDPEGRFKLSTTEAQAAFADLTLYTNAESCPMVRFTSTVVHAIDDRLADMGLFQVCVSNPMGRLS